jgi:protein TonB
MLNLLLAAAALAAQPTLPAEAPAPPPPKVGNLAMLFSSNDYPKEARKKKQQGAVRFRLDVSAEGRVSACTILASSGSAILDETTCRLVQQRARFIPARDREGRPTTDSQEYKINWVLP